MSSMVLTKNAGGMKICMQKTTRPTLVVGMLGAMKAAITI
jgi:hypothetical protein